MNKLFLIAISISASLFASAQTLTDGLVFIHNFSGNAADSSGNGLDLNVVGASLTADRFGTSNSAYLFDGVDDYLEIPSSPLIQIPPPVSFSCWVKTESLSQTDFKIFRTDEREYNYDGYFLNGWGNDNGELVLSVGGGLGDTSPGNRRSKSTDSTINLSQWHNVVGVIHDPLDMEIYIDCFNAGGTYSGSGPIEVSHSGSSGRIGSALPVFGIGETFFFGAIDQLAMWDRALPFSDVTKICSGELEGIIPVGVRQNALDIVKVVNPIIDKRLKIEIADKAEKVSALIYDLQGRMMSQKVLMATTEWHLSHFPQGIYLIKIDLDQKVITRKIVVM